MVTATIQFCGAGGTSEAARQAGITVEAAINHSEIAIETHEVNHPNAEHFQQAIEEIDPADVPDSDMLLTSPCCTNHAPAKGKKQYHSFDLFGDIVFDPLAEKSRNTMEDVVRFAAAKKYASKPYKIIIVENVIEVVKWRKYHTWLASLTALGYKHRNLYWNTQFFGVPQSRDRVYIIFWLHNLPAPNLEHQPPAWCEYCNCKIGAIQSWKTLFKWGCYREQYTYNCPYCTHEVVPHFTPARSILNLNDVGRPIGGRLVENIQKNITKGLKRLPGQQFLYGYYNNPVYRRLDEPIGTITTVDRWALITPAVSIEDTLHRMLNIQEVKRAMGFPESYIFKGTAKEQVWMLGNAVCPPIMTDILSRCLSTSSTIQEAA